MKCRLQRALVALLFLVVVAPSVAWADESSLAVSVRTDRYLYYSGQDVSAVAEVCNPTSETVVVSCGMACLESAFSMGIVDGRDEVVAEWYYNFSCAAVPIEYEFEPGECYTRGCGDSSGGWYPPVSDLPQGEYRVRFAWVSSGLVYDSQTFFISEGQAPTAVPSLGTAGLVFMSVAILLVGAATIRWGH